MLGLDLERPSSLGLSTCGRMLQGLAASWATPMRRWSGHKGSKAVWQVLPTTDLRKILQEFSEPVAWLYSQDVEVRKLKRG